jgi:hypothetical protein
MIFNQAGAIIILRHEDYVLIIPAVAGTTAVKSPLNILLLFS